MTSNDPHASIGAGAGLPLKEPDLTRRRALGVMGGTGAALIIGGCTRPGSPPGTTEPGGGGACRLTPEQTEGPYHIDDALVRSDITEGRPGAPLRLVIHVQDASCQALPDARVEIWHCDAGGVYSGFDAGAGNRTFLRGMQAADAEGKVEFHTIYPGWYQGRAIHIHVKVHVGGNEIHTGQIYFDEAVNDQVMAVAPYDARAGGRLRNASDFLYRAGGAQTLVTAAPEGSGYAGEVTLIVS